MKNSGSLWAVGGMVALFAGRRVMGLSMFARGLSLLEQGWRKAHPEFQGTFAERWKIAEQFYDRTHQHKTNRTMHMVGIPFITLGALGLLTLKPYRPAWAAAAGSFAVGWGLNIAGHVFYEKNRPAFEEDPLSFFAGPAWDVAQLFKGKKAADASPEPTVVEAPPVSTTSVSGAQPTMN